MYLTNFLWWNISFSPTRYWPILNNVRTPLTIRFFVSPLPTSEGPFKVAFPELRNDLPKGLQSIFL